MAIQRPASPTSHTISTRQSLTEPAAPEKQGMSPKTRQTIAIVGLVLCLLIGAGIIYVFMFGSSPKHRTVAVDPNAQTADMSGRPMIRVQRPQRPQTAITKEDDTNWQVRGSISGMRVRGTSSDYKLIPYYLGRELNLSTEQVALLSHVFRSLRDDAMAKEWGVTADQRARLKGVELTSSTLKLSIAEETDMRQFWNAYLQAGDGAPKSDAEKKVITRLDELAKANLDASRTAYIAKLDDVKKILTPEQVKTMSQR